MRLNREGHISAWTGGRTNTAGMFKCSSGAGGVSASPEMSSSAHPCVCQRGTAGEQTRALWPKTGYLGLDHGSVISPRARLQKTSGSYLCFKLVVEFVTCKPGSSESCLAVDVFLDRFCHTVELIRHLARLPKVAGLTPLWHQRPSLSGS